MAYNTVSIQKDVDGKPIPQYYDPILDAYRVLQGRNGANRVELYDADGNPIDLGALSTAIETILAAIKDTAGIKKIVDALPAGTNNIGKVTVDGSTRVELYDTDGNSIDLVGLIESIIDILNSRNLPVGASTEIKQDEIISNLVDILTKLQDGIKQDGSTMEYYGKSTDTKPTPDKVGATFFEIDTTTVFMWDGTDWVVI